MILQIEFEDKERKMDTFTRGMIYEQGRIELEQTEKREPRDREVLIRVESAAVCGGDLHMFRGKHPYVKFPCTIGHEVAGIVEAVGKGVTTIKVGDRVTSEPLMTCGECYWCRHGRYDYCENLKLKYKNGYSGFGQYYYSEEQFTHVLPENISLDVGSLMEPFACSVHAVRKGEINLGDTVCVLGDGPIALMIAQNSVISGASKVFISGHHERNLKIAEQYGCIPIPQGADIRTYILDNTDGIGVDVTFEAVGVPATFNLSMTVTRKGGKAIIFGLFEDEFNSKTLIDAMTREIEVIGSSSYCWDFQRGIQLVSSGRVNLDSLITDYYPLSKINEALTAKNTSEGRPIKIIIKPWEN